MLKKTSKALKAVNEKQLIQFFLKRMKEIFYFLLLFFKNKIGTRFFQF